MEFDFNLATFVVGLLSLAGVITNVIVTTMNNKKKRYTDLVTQRRLHTFQHIIDCSSNCIKSLYGVMTEHADDYALLQTFVENKSQIFYNTNYKAAAEKELRKALETANENNKELKPDDLYVPGTSYKIGHEGYRVW